MKYYFKITKPFNTIIAVEAKNISQAEQRIMSAYRRNEFEFDYNHNDDFEYEHTKKQEVDKTEDIEVLDCHEVVYDTEMDGYMCPVCNTFIVNRDTARYVDYPFPKYCSECGTRLE